jgi:hypothetical protein
MSFFDQVKSTLSNIPAGVRWAGAGAAGAVVLMVGATFATNAIAYERTCRGYEAQATETIDEMHELVSRTTVLAQRVERNPWAAFNVMGEMIEIAGSVEILTEESQTLRTDYVEACGVERVDRFFESGPVESRLEEIEEMATALQNL